MSLGEELTDRVTEIFRQQWSTREGKVVPEAEDLSLDNEAVEFKEATILYADLSGSTSLVDAYKWQFAAEVYKSFLYCAARLITAEGGFVTAYDGDRIMGVFIGNTKNTMAARTGLKINYCAKEIVNPLLKKQYPKTDCAVEHVVGIDTSSIRAARTGARGANDLVWVGRAANYAAKLTELAPSHATRITEDVYDRLLDTAKLGSDGRSMWEKVAWTNMNDMTIYRSNWWWKVS